VKTLVGMPVEPGSDDLLVVEVDASEVPDDLVLAATPGQVVVRAQVSLEEALNKLKPSLQKVLHLIKDLGPDQTTVEFGLQLGGETGVILAKGTAEVSFKVTMSWGQE
jgi:Trypsin-co-occurring domain 1